MSMARSHSLDLLVEATEGIERALLVAVERQDVVVGLDRAIDVLAAPPRRPCPSRRTARRASPTSVVAMMWLR